MHKAYKITSIKSSLLINSFIKVLVLFFLLSACQSLKTSNKTARLSDREVTYEKGLALFDNSKYTESAAFFLKISQNPLGPQDETYNLALWKLSFVYEKIGEYENAILALNEIEARKSLKVSLFSVRLSLIKNYLRVENRKKAMVIKSSITPSDLDKISLADLYISLEENVHFNYDHLMVEELQFLGEIQKYFILIMESQTTPLNTKSTDLLILLYKNFFQALDKDTLNAPFKRTLAIELLDQLRKFELYKRSEINFNPSTISKFSNYSVEKQKILTDWLHR